MNRHLRTLVAACLVATAAMSLLWTLLTPEFHDDPGDQLDALAAAGSTAWISALGFVFSQLPFAVGMAGLAAWLRPAAPRLATAGGVLAVLGAFGHTVVGGTSVMQLVMADAPEHKEAYAALIGDTMDSPVMVPFFAFGLLGTVLGVLFLSIAHFRAHLQPRWVGPALWSFLVLEFVGSNLSDWASYLGGVLYLAALAALARSVLIEQGPSLQHVRDRTRPAQGRPDPAPIAELGTKAANPCAPLRPTPGRGERCRGAHGDGSVRTPRRR